MLFSILIANFNNSRFLTTAIQSVLTQTYTNWEIILVDDGSTDDFERLMVPFLPDNRIRLYMNEKNEGCGFTKRKCAEKASGDVLAFLDPDDVLHPTALKVMKEAHEKLPLCSLIYSTHYICDELLNVKRIASYPRDLPADTPYLLLNDGSIHAFATFKKHMYQQTSGISAKNKKAVDQDLYYKLEEVGKVQFINKPLYYYRIHEGSISTFGKEGEATLWHYSIIEEACLRRIKSLKTLKTTLANSSAKKYKTRYLKIKVFHNFRKKNWVGFTWSFLHFCISGGMQNMISYSRKFPKEGVALLRRSFIDNYEIK
jgi:glycosyltransferase involved in cell wall biosynthesis